MIVSIPKTRDPFVNVRLVPAGFDEETGEERFWISTYNSNSGCMGALITMSGNNKIFRFDYTRHHFGFYSAAYAGDNTMWLCGFLNEVIRLDLSSGEIVSWSTGLSNDLVFSGMVYDSVTKKLFTGTYCQKKFGCEYFSFDTEKGEVAAIYSDLPLKNNYLKDSVKNNDGTYTLMNVNPKCEFLLWNPVNETAEIIAEGSKNSSIITRRDDGAIYLPDDGWFDPVLRSRVTGHQLAPNISWFAISGNTAYGAEEQMNGNSMLFKQNILSEHVEPILEVPDISPCGFRLTECGKIVAVNMYGYFYRIDPQSRSMEDSVKIDSDAVGAVDCLYRIDEKRLLFTPFITQRFGEINVEDDCGYDLGRATNGPGQVAKVAQLGEKIYMASYTRGELVEYDPSLLPHFPENPRLVAKPPTIAMRPVAMCVDDESLYYSCSHEYGKLGSMLIKYTPGKGVMFLDDTLPLLAITSLAYDKEQNIILAGTTYHADCKSCRPETNKCVLAKINKDTLLPEAVLEAPQNCEQAEVVGQLSKDKYLCRFHSDSCELVYAELDILSFTYEKKDYGFDEGAMVLPANRQGDFVVAHNKSIELWDLCSCKKIKDICTAGDYRRLYIQDNSLYIIYRTEIHILENVLMR